MVVMVMNPLKLLRPVYGFIWKWLLPEDLAALIDMAIESGDEHAVIIVDICLRELRHKPQISLLAATWDAVKRLSAKGNSPEIPA